MTEEFNLSEKIDNYFRDQSLQLSDQEQTILFNLIIYPEKLQECELLPEDFIIQIHGTIYKSLCEMANKKMEIDIVTVLEYMEANNSPGLIIAMRIMREWIHSLVRYSNPNHMDSYFKIFKKKSQQRKSLHVAAELFANFNDDNAIDIGIQKLMRLNKKKNNFELTITQCLKLAVDDIEKNMKKGDALVGYSTGYKKMDETLGGLHDSDLIVVGARPAMGKTAFLLNLMINTQQSVGIISTEQGGKQLAMRTLAIKGSVGIAKMRNGKVEDIDLQKITNAAKKLISQKIWINDEPAISIVDLVRQARKWKYKHDIKILGIDYLQRIKGDDRITKRHERIGEIVVTLKELARELDIPIVLLAQVNRRVDERANKRPGMADLKDSGDIEQEADQVMFLYRDEVYNMETKDKGIMEIHLDKNRHGEVGYWRVYWKGEYLQVKCLMQDSYEYEGM